MVLIINYTMSLHSRVESYAFTNNYQEFISPAKSACTTCGILMYIQYSHGATCIIILSKYVHTSIPFTTVRLGFLSYLILREATRFM